MQFRKAYKFRLYIKPKHKSMLSQFEGNCRFVFNKGLALQKQNHADGGKFIGYAQMCKELTQWKSEESLDWLNLSPSHTLQQSLKQLEVTFKNFFEKRAEFPKFKKKGMGSGIRFPSIKEEHIDRANGRIKLPKLGWMRFRQSQKIVGTVKNATISRSGEHWFIAIQVEQEVENPVTQATSQIGLDMGVAVFAMCSDGKAIEHTSQFKNHQSKLAKLQRGLARKVKFSNNWRNHKRKITKLHQLIANSRKDALHKSSTQLSQSQAMIAVEDLSIRNMSSSAKGNSQKHGKNVKQKSGLNRSILDQGWGEFIRQLKYKMDWNGGMVVDVPPQYTSQTCPCCGHIHKDNRKTRDTFSCTECGYENHADVVGAKNVLAKADQMLSKEAVGHTVSACGEMVQLGRSMKQETTEALEPACG